MKNTLVLALVMALSGCSLIEKSIAQYVLNRYVGIWQKAGASDDSRGTDSALCVMASLDSEGTVTEQKYRDCMTSKGWVLNPVPIDSLGVFGE